MKKAMFRFNNGLLAILCSNCSAIIKTGKDFTIDEMRSAIGENKTPAQYCNDCKGGQAESK